MFSNKFPSYKIILYPKPMESKRLAVENYLKNEGFFINDGIKYGLDFLAYTGEPGKVHSKYGVLVLEKMNFQQLVAYQRICCSNNKLLIIAIVDDKSHIKLVEFKRFELNCLKKQTDTEDCSIKKRQKISI